MATVAAETRPAHRSKLYIAIGILSFVFVFVGFWQVYFGPVFFQAAHKATILHVHAAVFLGYLALFTAQAGFAAARRIDLHTRVGRFGVAYGIVIILVGLATDGSRREQERAVGAEGRILSPRGQGGRHGAISKCPAATRR